MNPRIFRIVAGLALGVAWTAGAAAAEGAAPFRPIDPAAAVKAAQAEGKPIFIDFYTTWCEPCRRLDQRTWTDARVAALLARKTVALKLDAEKEGRALAKQHKVAAYPTLVMLKPDGEEIGRIVGFREAAPMLAALEGLLQRAGR